MQGFSGDEWSSRRARRRYIEGTERGLERPYRHHQSAKGCLVTVGSYLRVLRRRWKVLAVMVLVGLIAAAVTTYLMPKTYASSATIFVSISSTGDEPDALYQNSQFALNRVGSYTRDGAQPGSPQSSDRGGRP